MTWAYTDLLLAFYALLALYALLLAFERPLDNGWRPATLSWAA